MTTIPFQRTIQLSLSAMVLTFAGLAPSLSQAQGQPTAVFDVIAEGADDQLAAQISAVLKQEAGKNPKFELVQQEDIALLESLLMFDCEEPTPVCMSQLGGSLNAKQVIYGRLIAKGDLYDIEVNIFDVPEKRVWKRWNKRFTANADAIGFFVREMEIFIGGKVRADPIRLRVNANVDDASVLVDGQRVGRTPYVNEDLEPGTHEIQVQKEGHSSWSHTVEATAGAELVLRADLAPGTGQIVVEDQGGGDRPAVETEGMRLATYGWVTAGLGTASLLTGAVFAILMQQTQTEFDDTPYEKEARDLADKGDTQAMAANVFFGIGGAALVAGIILIIADEGESGASALRPGSSSDRALRLVPSLSPDGAAVSIGLSF